MEAVYGSWLVLLTAAIAFLIWQMSLRDKENRMIDREQWELGSDIDHLFREMRNVKHELELDCFESFRQSGTVVTVYGQNCASREMEQYSSCHPVTAYLECQICTNVWPSKYGYAAGERCPSCNSTDCRLQENID